MSLERLREHAAAATPEMQAKIVALFVSQVEVRLEGTVVSSFTLRASARRKRFPPRLRNS